MKWRHEQLSGKATLIRLYISSGCAFIVHTNFLNETIHAAISRSYFNISYEFGHTRNIFQKKALTKMFLAREFLVSWVLEERETVLASIWRI